MFSLLSMWVAGAAAPLRPACGWLLASSCPYKNGRGGGRERKLRKAGAEGKGPGEVASMT